MIDKSRRVRLLFVIDNSSLITYLCQQKTKRRQSHEHTKTYKEYNKFKTNALHENINIFYQSRTTIILKYSAV